MRLVLLCTIDPSLSDNVCAETDKGRRARIHKIKNTMAKEVCLFMVTAPGWGRREAG
jgi:hypothetical protein